MKSKLNHSDNIQSLRLARSAGICVFAGLVFAAVMLFSNMAQGPQLGTNQALQAVGIEAVLDNKASSQEWLRCVLQLKASKVEALRGTALQESNSQLGYDNQLRSQNLLEYLGLSQLCPNPEQILLATSQGKKDAYCIALIPVDTPDITTSQLFEYLVQAGWRMRGAGLGVYNFEQSTAQNIWPFMGGDPGHPQGDTQENNAPEIQQAQTKQIQSCQLQFVRHEGRISSILVLVQSA